MVGYYSDARVEPFDGEALPPYLGRYADAVASIRANDYEIVFLAMGQLDNQDITADIVDRLQDSTAAIYLVP